MYEILLYYKYTNIANPGEFCNAQKSLCEQLGLTGRIIIAPEGINGTVEGLKENTQKYIDKMISDPRFTDMNFKRSIGTGNAFPKLSVKARSEIVSAHLGEKDVNPAITTGKYLAPEQLHEWIHSSKEFYIVDMRNDYEHCVGFFKNSILPPLKNFRDLPKILPKLAHLKNKTVVTVCTGGVRCEKASGFLVENGFNDVYQLHNGIVSYMEKYPDEDFAGKLYVFDGRVTMAFSSENNKHEIVGHCRKCGTSNENFVNCLLPTCHDHFICCQNCLNAKGEPFCSWRCALINKFRNMFMVFRHIGKRG
ncbi:MAG TPA: rhodanese-related sulfurtransferase [Candidatus Udaeobacter sp.]|nr:rhodanese-related sulfurtransferase [Candidatus Udaeobacter sp.]